jgi:inorganic pyrophosphatase
MFFQVYKTLELKPGQSVSIDNFLDADHAFAMVKDCIKRYEEKFDKKKKD